MNVTAHKSVTVTPLSRVSHGPPCRSLQVPAVKPPSLNARPPAKRPTCASTVGTRHGLAAAQRPAGGRAT